MALIYKDLKSSLNITLNKSDTISIILNDDLDIHYDLKDGDYKILIFNDSHNDLKLVESGDIINSNVEINVIELNDNSLVQDSNINVYSNSYLKIFTTYLGLNNKKIDYHLINKERDSMIEIENNIVCLKDSDFNLNIVGKIIKGSKHSKCFQKSRCLTFEDPKKAKVLPVLEIDENDVEASHSLSSGTIDEDVLFYMNSRGLSKKAALSLLLVSYLMPSEGFYKDFPSGLMIKEMAEKKVEKVCSM